MKKLIALVSLLLLASACATEPTGNKNMAANANKGGEMKTTAAPSEADIVAKEKAAWDAFRKKDAAAFEKVITPDYFEVTDAGVTDKTAAISGMKDFDITDVSFADWKMTTIDKDAVIITYTVTVKGTLKGQALPAGPYREASVYVNRNDNWLGAYYQETLTHTGPPPSTPAAKESPKAASSPMAKPGETGPDVTANEKLVWDALKNRNYDAFASYLASDATEIEADGVYDKAGSVKGVSAFDFSKTTLADWKTMKLDDDASLVTYTVNMPGMKPEKEYHTTVWVKRDSKWMAIFHMGTPAGETTGAAKPDMKKM